MRRFIVASAFVLSGVNSPLAAQPRVTPVFELVGHHVSWPAATRDGNRIYYQRDSSAVFIYDRRTRQHTHVFAGRAIELEVSGASDRLVFVRAPEDGGESHVWAVQLDPRTGLAVGNPRRVSVTSGHFPAFSPDGKSIAFSRGPEGEVNDLVIVPTVGGPERTIVQKHGAIYPVRWGSDGRSIFYGSNMNTNLRGAVNATFRVSVAGGTPQRVMDHADWGGYPGLSPDGRTLLTWTTGWDSIAVSTAEGKRLVTYAPHFDASALDNWIDGMRGLYYHNRAPAVMSVLSINGSKVTTRLTSDSLLSLATGSWSPDGRRLAATSSRRARDFSIFDETGVRRRVPTAIEIVQGNFSSWSPDGRRIAYKTGGSWWPSPIRVVEIGSGADRVLAPASSRSLPIRWTADGQNLIYGVLDTAMASDSTRSLQVRQVSLNGTDKLLRKITTRCTVIATPCYRYLNDSTIVMLRGLEYRVFNLRDNADGRVLFTRTRPGQGNPTVSENGRWIAIREPDATGGWNVHVVSADGTSKRSVKLPEPSFVGAHNPHISADGAQLLVVTRPNTTTGLNLYRIAVATGAATKLHSVPSGEQELGQHIMFSPDGTSMLYATPLKIRGTVQELDLSPLLRGAAAGRR